MSFDFNESSDYSEKPNIKHCQVALFARNTYEHMLQIDAASVMFCKY